MPLERIWAIILSAALLIAFVVNALWNHRNAPRFEAVATFNGYTTQPGQTQINASWPVKQWAQVDVTRIIRDDLGYGRRSMSIGLADTSLKTDRGRPLVKNQTYSFHFRYSVFKRSGSFRLKVRELPPTANTPDRKSGATKATPIATK
jgi:hypothetical protein